MSRLRLGAVLGAVALVVVAMGGLARGAVCAAANPAENAGVMASPPTVGPLTFSTTHVLFTVFVPDADGRDLTAFDGAGTLQVGTCNIAPVATRCTGDPAVNELDFEMDWDDVTGCGFSSTTLVPDARAGFDATVSQFVRYVYVASLTWTETVDILEGDDTVTRTVIDDVVFFLDVASKLEGDLATQVYDAPNLVFALHVVNVDVVDASTVGDSVPVEEAAYESQWTVLSVVQQPFLITSFAFADTDPTPTDVVVGTTTLDSTVDTSFGQANLLNSQFHTATYSTALGQTPCSMEGYYRYKVTVGCQDPLPDEWVHAMGTDAPGEHVSCPLTTADLATEYIVVLNMTHLNFCPLQGGLLDTAVTFTGGIEISDNDVDEGTSSPTRCLTGTPPTHYRVSETMCLTATITPAGMNDFETVEIVQVVVNSVSLLGAGNAPDGPLVTGGDVTDDQVIDLSLHFTGANPVVTLPQNTPTAVSFFVHLDVGFADPSRARRRSVLQFDVADLTVSASLVPDSWVEPEVTQGPVNTGDVGTQANPGDGPGEAAADASTATIAVVGAVGASLMVITAVAVIGVVVVRRQVSKLHALEAKQTDVAAVGGSSSLATSVASGGDVESAASALLLSDESTVPYYYYEYNNDAGSSGEDATSSVSASSSGTELSGSGSSA